MASASAVPHEIGKDFLECSICFERYTNPKILSCVHSFCEKCLVKYYGKDKEKPCPICRQRTRLPVSGGIGGLKTNGFLITLREKIELQEKVAETSDKAKRMCELCTENEVTHHCLNCSQNICATCKNFHLRIKGMADHQVGTLEEIREGKVTIPEVQNEYTCNKHKGESKLFYCETCHDLICNVCTVVDHCKPEHQYIDCAEASAKYKKCLKEIFPTFTIDIEKVGECLLDAYTEQHTFQKKVSQTVQEVKNGADRLRANVKAEEDRLLEEIRVLEGDRNKTFEEHIKSIKSLLQRKQHTMTIATDVTTKGSDSDFLSLFPIINQDLTFLRSYVSPKIDAKCHYLRLYKTPGSVNLGVLDPGDTKWELFCEVGGDWTERSTFQSVSDIAALRGDKLAVASSLGHLVIFNTAGELVKTIQTNGQLCGVAMSYASDGLVVADNSGNVEIHKLNSWQHVQFRQPYPKAQLTCVCSKKNNTILVGHLNKDVTLHHPDGTFIRKISLKRKSRFLATDSNDRVVVSGFDDNQVTVIDDRGDTLVAIKPTMNGQPVSCCSGVCCDGSDIYVSVNNLDSDSGHIHRYDGRGMFISCIVRGLRQPAGITLTEDGQHLAVVDNDIVKIYQRV